MADLTLTTATLMLPTATIVTATRVGVLAAASGESACLGPQTRPAGRLEIDVRPAPRASDAWTGRAQGAPRRAALTAAARERAATRRRSSSAAWPGAVVGPATPTAATPAPPPVSASAARGAPVIRGCSVTAASAAATPATCDGCCSGAACLSGIEAFACGLGGEVCVECEPAEICVAGVCLGCYAETCPDGCCLGGLCHTSSFLSCGLGGETCQVCDPTAADACSGEGRCTCAGDLACDSGQICTALGCL